MKGARNRSTKTIVIGTSLRDLPVQRHFAALGREIVELGYQAALVVHGRIDDADFLDPRVTVLRWPSPRPTRFADALFFHRLVRRLQPSCLISNFGALSIMMTIGGLRHVPVRIHWHHTLSSQIEADWTGSRLGLRLLRLRARIPLRFVTHVIANSEAAKQDVIQNFGVPAKKCQVFWNSLNDPLPGLTLADPARRNPQNRCRFACVGRLEASKGQDVLLQALALVKNQHPNVVVEFIGDGTFRSRYQEMAGSLGVSNNCIFTGILPHPEVLSRMAEARATVVPSRNEAFGLVNIESMAVGVPVVASNTGGIPEIVRPGVDGFLVPPGDHQALALRMIDLIEKDSVRHEMAASCRRRFLELFESSRAVKLEARWIIEQVTTAADEPCPHRVRVSPSSIS